MTDTAAASGVLDVRVGGQAFRVVEGHNPTFWGKVNAGEWEGDTFVVLGGLLREGVTYVDCGAWIGPTVLYAAACRAKVTTFECDPVAIERLGENLALNPDLARRVELVKAAVSDRDGPLVLHSARFGNSQSSVFDVVERKGEALALTQHVTVEAVDARRVFQERGWLMDPDALVKIDTEGGEYPILRALAPRIPDARCSFFISFHPFNLAARDGRPERLVRARATLEWIDLFWDWTWWSGAGEALSKIDKARYLELALAGKTLPAILFSRRDDLDAA